MIKGLESLLNQFKMFTFAEEDKRRLLLQI